MLIPEIVQLVMGATVTVGAVGLLVVGLIPNRWTNSAMRYSLAISAMPVGASARWLLNADTGFDVVHGVAILMGTGVLLSSLLKYQKHDAALGGVGESPLPAPNVSNR